MGDPWVLDIEAATINNLHYRAVQWTGENMQMVLMSVGLGEEIDLEMHENLDQFIRLEQGEATVLKGETENDLSYEREISGNWAAFIPAGFITTSKIPGILNLNYTQSTLPLIQKAPSTKPMNKPGKLTKNMKKRTKINPESPVKKQEIQKAEVCQI